MPLALALTRRPSLPCKRQGARRKSAKQRPHAGLITTEVWMPPSSRKSLAGLSPPPPRFSAAAASTPPFACAPKPGPEKKQRGRHPSNERWRVRRGCEWSAALDPCSPDGWQRRDPKRRMERSSLSPPNQRRRDPASCGCFRHFGVYGRSLLQSSDLSSQSQAHNPAYRSAGSGTSVSLLGVATESRETTCPARVPESQRSYIADRHQVFLGFFLVGEG